MKKLLYFSLAALLFAACGNSILYDEERTFNNNVWNGFTPEVYTLDINNIEDYYNIDITVAVDTARYRFSPLYWHRCSERNFLRAFCRQSKAMRSVRHRDAASHWRRNLTKIRRSSAIC